jgi:hypothetical protein
MISSAARGSYFRRPAAKALEEVSPSALVRKPFVFNSPLVQRTPAGRWRPGKGTTRQMKDNVISPAKLGSRDFLHTSYERNQVLTCGWELLLLSDKNRRGVGGCPKTSCARIRSSNLRASFFLQSEEVKLNGSRPAEIPPDPPSTLIV